MVDVKERITDYLVLGGLFNPERANHTAVRDLLIDCRSHIDVLEKEKEELRAAIMRFVVAFEAAADLYDKTEKK